MNQTKLWFPLFCLFLSMSAESVSAQKINSDQCTVDVLDVVYESNDAYSFRPDSSVELGTFETVAKAGGLTSRAYRLPHTRLFVVARVLYQDDFLSERSPANVTMTLSVSDKKRGDLRTMSAYAEAYVPFDTLSTCEELYGTVSTFIKLKGRSAMKVRLSCAKNVRV